MSELAKPDEKHGKRIAEKLGLTGTPRSKARQGDAVDNMMSAAWCYQLTDELDFKWILDDLNTIVDEIGDPEPAPPYDRRHQMHRCLRLAQSLVDAIEQSGESSTPADNNLNALFMNAFGLGRELYKLEVDSLESATYLFPGTSIRGYKSSEHRPER
jgi:hypothetical protein